MYCSSEHLFFPSVHQTEPHRITGYGKQNYSVNNLMWAVPCFLMNICALLLDRRKETPYKKLFTKYIGKMFLVILIFTLIYSISDMFLNGQPGFGEALLQGIYKSFTDTSWSHMWYLYTF